MAKRQNSSISGSMYKPKPPSNMADLIKLADLKEFDKLDEFVKYLFTTEQLNRIHVDINPENAQFDVFKNKECFIIKKQSVCEESANRKDFQNYSKLSQAIALDDIREFDSFFVRDVSEIETCAWLMQHEFHGFNLSLMKNQTYRSWGRHTPEQALKRCKGVMA